jgi:hypothetical protein
LPEYLTKRRGVWQFVHRVPQKYAELDRRGVIKHSTHIEVIKDRRGTRAGKIADEMKRDLEAYWRGLAEGNADEASLRYAEATQRARTCVYADTAEMASRFTVEVLERLEKLEKLMLERLEELEKLVSTGSGRGRRRLKIKK